MRRPAGAGEEDEEATATLAHDLVVVLLGIMGSTLVRDGHEVWGPSRRLMPDLHVVPGLWSVSVGYVCAVASPLVVWEAKRA